MAKPALLFSERLRSSREANRAGATPTISPTSTAAPVANIQTARSAVRSSCTGSSVGRRHVLTTRVPDPGDGRAAHAAADGEQHRFGQQLPRDARLAGAERGAQRDLAGAIVAAREQQAGEVRAARQHQQHAEAEQAPHEGPCRAAEHVAEQSRPRQPELQRAVARMLLAQLRDRRADRRLGAARVSRRAAAARPPSGSAWRGCSATSCPASISACIVIGTQISGR